MNWHRADREPYIARPRDGELVEVLQNFMAAQSSSV